MLVQASQATFHKSWSSMTKGIILSFMFCMEAGFLPLPYLVSMKLLAQRLHHSGSKASGQKAHGACSV